MSRCAGEEREWGTVRILCRAVEPRRIASRCLCRAGETRRITLHLLCQAGKARRIASRCLCRAGETRRIALHLVCHGEETRRDDGTLKAGLRWLKAHRPATATIYSAGSAAYATRHKFCVQHTSCYNQKAAISLMKRLCGHRVSVGNVKKERPNGSAGSVSLGLSGS